MGRLEGAYLEIAMLCLQILAIGGPLLGLVCLVMHWRVNRDPGDDDETPH